MRQSLNTGLISVPIPEIVISTMSPARNAKSDFGNDPRARQQEHTLGNEFSRPSQEIKLSKLRAILSTEVAPSNTTCSFRAPAFRSQCRSPEASQWEA